MSTAEIAPHRRSPYVLREYALLADGERGALIGPRGDVAWMCAPRWDSPAVFGGLLGAPGRYEITPNERFVWGGYYEDASLIWRSRWVTETGIIECREALAWPSRSDRATLLRRIRAVTGDASVSVVLDPRAEYGAQPLRDISRDEHGRWTARSGDLWVRWSGAGDATVVDDAATGTHWRHEIRVVAGSWHDLVLEIGTGTPEEPPDPEITWRETQAAWERAVPRLEDSVAPREAAHAVAVLRGLTTPGGGMIASPTTALPERAEAGRDYDYRYVWVRDQCYAAQAAAAAGIDDLLDDAVRFLGARILADGSRLAPAYAACGGPVPEQTAIDVPGYPGGGRQVGNHVRHQFQLDAFGEILLVLAAAARHGRLDAEGRRAAEATVAAIAERWGDADAGVWELEPRRWTHSRLICAAGLRAWARAHDGGRGARAAADWSALADRIVADTAAHATHPSGRWQRAPDDPRHDGALLLPALRGAVPADDPRSLATLRSYVDELTSEGYAFRFRHDDRPLGEAEGAFLLCGFVLAMAEHQIGDEIAARHYFERGRSACGPPGLYAEEFDVVQRQLRGNLPQAFVHAAALEASVRLAGDPGASG